VDTLLALSGTALAWLFYGATIIGLGAIFLRPTFRAVGISISICIWTGLALLVTILQLVNLFCGIDIVIVRSICLIGLLSFWLCRGQLDVTFWTRLRLWQKAFAAVFLLWILDRAIGPHYVADSGLYHFASVRWANEQPLPPGLGNLHGRLAFNQSYFLFAGFVNLLPKRGDGHTFANSLLVFFTLITILETGADPAQRRSVRTIIQFLGPLLFFFALLFNHTNEPGLSSPSPDAALFCLEISMFALALSTLNRIASKNHGQRAAQLTAVLFLSALAVTFKLSTLLFSIGIAFLVIVSYLRTNEGNRIPRELLWPLIVVPAAMIGTWVTRSVIASGYLIYPIASTGCPVSWRVPVDQVRSDHDWILSWPRAPGVPPATVLADYSWLPAWSHRVIMRPDFILCLSLLAFSLLLLAVLWIRSPTEAFNRTSMSTSFLALTVVCAASMGFWFFTAPDPRFIEGILALLALSALGLTLEAACTRSEFLTAMIGSGVIFAAGFALAFEANGLGLFKVHKPQIGSRIPVAELTQKVTASGLRVGVPVEGDKTWDAPLPATPYFNNNLRLRGKDLASGFCVSTERRQ